MGVWLMHTFSVNSGGTEAALRLVAAGAWRAVCALNLRLLSELMARPQRRPRASRTRYPAYSGVLKLKQRLSCLGGEPGDRYMPHVMSVAILYKLGGRIAELTRLEVLIVRPRRSTD